MDDREKMRFQKEIFVRTSRATLWLTGETSWGVKFDWGEKLTVGQFTGKKSWLVRKVYWWESTLVRKVDWSFYHQLALCFQYKRDSGVDLFLKNDRTSAHIFPHLFGFKLSITSKKFWNCLWSIWVLKLCVLKRTGKRLFAYSPLLGGKILLRGQVNQFTDQKSSLVRKFTGDKIWWNQLIVEPVDYSAVVLVNIFFFVETVKFMKILQIVYWDVMCISGWYWCNIFMFHDHVNSQWHRSLVEIT